MITRRRRRRWWWWCWWWCCCWWWRRRRWWWCKQHAWRLWNIMKVDIITSESSIVMRIVRMVGEEWWVKKMTHDNFHNHLTRIIKHGHRPRHNLHHEIQNHSRRISMGIISLTHVSLFAIFFHRFMVAPWPSGTRVGECLRSLRCYWYSASVALSSPQPVLHRWPFPRPIYWWALHAHPGWFPWPGCKEQWWITNNRGLLMAYEPSRSINKTSYHLAI